MRVHYINLENDFNIAYFPDTKRFFKINEYGKNLIDDICFGKSQMNILNHYSITKEDYDRYYNLIKETKECSGCKVGHNESTHKTLSRLVIHLTNDCNLRCKYCYANGGAYFSDKGKLTSKMLDNILERFFGEFDTIKVVQFFGGEPLMNIPLLKEACEKIKAIDSERGNDTTFGLVTNGTIMNDEIIELIKKFKIKVTVSYDGHPEINNLSRIYENGKGTSEIILQNMKKLKEETSEPNTIEVTYNKYHVDNGITILDVVNHIQDQVPNTYIHLVPAGGDKECDYTIKNLDIFTESINDIYKELEKGNSKKSMGTFSLADRIFYALGNKNTKGSPYICDAGIGTISVSIQGDVYPCFMFTDMEKVRLGNINDENLFNSDRFKGIRNKFLNFSFKENNQECKACFINTLCNGCLGLNSYHSGDPLKLSREICDMFRDMVTTIIINHAKIIEKNKVVSSR